MGRGKLWKWRYTLPNRESCRNLAVRIIHPIPNTASGNTVSPKKEGGSNTWSAELPIFSNERPLWVFANVHYRMEKPITGAGYYYGIYETDTFVLSSLMQVANAEVLTQSGSDIAPYQDLMIEKFSGNWSKDWFSYNRQKWGIRTNKLHEPKWAAPSEDSRLSIEVRSADPNVMALWIDGHGAELNLVGGKSWQRFYFSCKFTEECSGRGAHLLGRNQRAEA